MISNWTLGSGSVLTPRRLVYTPGEVACGAYCVGALRRDCARAGEAIDAIMAIITAMQTCLMAHLRCERHLVRHSIDCNHMERVPAAQCSANGSSLAASHLARASGSARTLMKARAASGTAPSDI